MLRRIMFALWLGASVSVAHALEAESHAAALFYLEDPSAELDFDQARTQSFTPFSGLLSRGYTESVHWLRVTVVPGDGAATDDLIVRIRPAYLDDLQLFDPAMAPDKVRATGDRHPVSGDAYPSLYFNLAIPRGNAPRDIWLRLQTSSTSQIHVDVLERNDAIRLDRSHEMMFMFYLAALMLFLGWGLVSWVAERERLMGVFVLKQLVGLMYSLAYLGYLRLLWPDGLWAWCTPDTVTSLLVVTMVGAAYLFDYSFLGEFHARQALLGIMRVAVLLCPVLLVLVLLGQVREALLLNNLLVVCSPLLAFATALSLPATASRPERDKLLLPKSYVVVLYLLVLLSVSVSSLPAAGLFNGTEWTFSGYLMYSLCTGAMVLVMLQIRATRLRQQRIALATALHSAEQRAEVEQFRRQEQGSFLAMLAHELKTPLAVMQMVLSAPRQTPEMLAQAQRANHSMEEVINRCLQVNRLEDARIQPRLEHCDLVLELDALLAASGDGERIQLRMDTLPVLRTDITLMRMIVANLIDNALKYGAPDAPVSVLVTLAEQGGAAGVCVEVSNFPGKAGWPDRDLVFTKFYRESRARNASGSGLGLFLAQGLSTLLGGQLSYSPGTEEIRFRLWIPLR